MPVSLISHRGVRDPGITENTQIAFDKACTFDFEYLETDLRLTADKEIVLCHDESFSRLIEGDQELIVGLDRLSISRRRYPCGQQPMFLEDFLSRYRAKKFVFDVKPESSQGVLEVLIGHKAARRVDFSIVKFVLWRKADIDFVKQHFPESTIYADKNACWRAGLSAMYAGGFFGGIASSEVYSLPPVVFGKELYTKEIVRRYHQRGAKVLAFLPRSRSEFKAAIDCGFDEILSDDYYPI